MAKRFFRVQDGDRPDLAAIGSTSQLDMKGYAFPKLFPLLPVTERSGTMRVAPAGLTESKGTKGRSNGTTLSGTAIEMVDVSWSVARYEGRGKLYEDDGAAYSSAEAADNAGAELSQRLAWNKVEDDAFKTVFTASRKSGATELSDHAVVKTLQKKAKKLRKYGTPTLVMTTNTWLDFVEIPEIRFRLHALADAGKDIGFILTDIDKVREAVSTFLGFGSVVLFDSDIIDTAGTCDGVVAVVGIRKIEGSVVDAVKAKAVYGWTPIYIPEDAPADKPFDMSSWYDKENKANVYDAEAFLGIVEAFSGAVETCKMAESYTEYAVPVVNNTITPAGSGT